MTVPESIIIVLVTCILAVIGWAAQRVVLSNDKTASALDDIKEQIGLVNGRLGKAETWQLMHGDDDARRFQSIMESQKEMWHTINQQRS